MIPLSYALFALIVSILGNGILCKEFLKKLGLLQNTNNIGIGETGFFGLFFTCLLSVILNFFTPIHNWISYTFLAIGFIAACSNYQKIKSQKRFSRDFIIFFFAIFTLLVLNTFSGKLLDDTGLYHLQVIRLTQEYSTIKGLGNLFPNYAFNNSWYPAAALLNVPLANNTSIFLINILALFYFITYFYEEFLNSKSNSQRPFVLLFVFSILAYAIFVKWSLIIKAASGPTADLISALLVVYCGFLFIKPSALFDRVSKMILFSLLALTVKVSSIILLIFPFYLIFTHRKKMETLKIAQIFSFAITAILLPWLLRGLYLSGCFLFPSKHGCFANLAWAMPLKLVEDTEMVVKVFARYYPNVNGLDFRSHQTTWDWILPWFKTQMLESSSQFLVLSIFFFLAIKSVKKIKLDSSCLTLILLSIIPLTFWFFTAPSVRFIEGYVVLLFAVFTSASLFTFKISLPKLQRVVTILLALSLARAAYAARKSLDLGLLGHWPKIPTPRSQLINVGSTDEYRKPIDYVCWDLPRPCTIGEYYGYDGIPKPEIISNSNGKMEIHLSH